MTPPIELLKDEHRTIERVLDCLDLLANRGKAERKIDGETAKKILTFLARFADECHHAKEEELLFPAMESNGFSPEAGPTAVMRDEHVAGRKHIRAMRDSVDGAAHGEVAQLKQFLEHAGSYTGLLRPHIEKEDRCLFPMAQQALSAEALESLSSEFAHADRELADGETAESLRRLADELARHFGLFPASPS